MTTINKDQKIILDVPVRYQPEGSLECSIAAVKMVMDYWNDIIPHDILTTELSKWINEKERHIQGVATYLAKRGYEVWLTHHDPNVVDETIENATEKSKSRLVETLKKISENDFTYYRRKKISLDIAYIEAGGHYSNTIPTLDLIDTNLHKKTPIIICVNARIWLSAPEKKNNHYVVVIGKEGDEYIVNDPSPKASNPYKVHKNKLLMSWYACGAYSLVIRPRKKLPPQE